MKHFVEARQAAMAAGHDPAIQPLVEKICLLFDLRGMCRVLVQPAAGQDPQVVEAELHKLFSSAADVFWAGEVWSETPDTTPSKRAVYQAAWNQAIAEPGGQSKTFVLDRRFSKTAWFGSPFSPPWPFNEHTPPIISFFSFKGGVGRTTALAAVAVNLARAGKRTLVLDFDLEAPGAGTLLLPATGQATSLGIVDFLLEWPVTPKNQRDVSPYCHICDEPRVIANGTEIVVVPAGAVDESYLEKLARVNYEFLYRTAAEPNAPSSPLHDLFNLLRHRWKPDFVLVDSRAGFHDLGGLSLSGLAHWHVLFGLASEQSWQGLSVAISHLGKQEVMAGRKQRDCTLVHAMAPAPGPAREQAVQGFKERSFEVFAAQYFDPTDKIDAEWPVPDLEASESPHFPLVSTWDSRVSGYADLADVADFLVEGEYRELTQLILERTGRQAL